MADWGTVSLEQEPAQMNLTTLYRRDWTPVVLNSPTAPLTMRREHTHEVLRYDGNAWVPATFTT